MKNRKLPLAAIAILAIVTTSLAFKPAMGLGRLYCKPLGSGTCSITPDYIIVVGATLTLYCGTTPTSCAHAGVKVPSLVYVGE